MDLYLGEGTCFQRAKDGSVPANQNTFGGLTARLGVFPEAANPPGGAAPVMSAGRVSLFAPVGQLSGVLSRVASPRLDKGEI
jgi:hypothetical protein